MFSPRRKGLLTSLSQAQARRMSSWFSMALGHKRACHGSSFQLSQSVLSTAPSLVSCPPDVSHKVSTIGNVSIGKELVESGDPRVSPREGNKADDALLMSLPSLIQESSSNVFSPSLSLTAPAITAGLVLGIPPHLGLLRTGCRSVFGCPLPMS